MRTTRIILPIFAVALAFTVAGAGPVAPSADAEANRRFLRDLRETDADQYARLVRNFDRFRALPPEQQERLRQLDRDIHAEDQATQARLLRILGEYGSWLSRLPEAERVRIQSAATAEERLKVVREIRDEQWARTLPTARFQQWKQAGASERRKLSEAWRQEDAASREDWAEARRWEGPLAAFGQDAFRADLTAFVERKLAPMLSAEERGKLVPKEADRGRGMLWLRTIADLAETHPVLALEPTHLKKADLPPEYQRMLENPPRGVTRKDVAELPEGKWPQYPVAVSRLMRAAKIVPKAQLGPATAAEFSPAMVAFVAALSLAERERLAKFEKQWPEYPRELHAIARERKLALPDLGLPGDPKLWEFVRTRVNEPPEHLLKDFFVEWSRRDPSARRLSLQDKDDREKIKAAFIQANPDWQRRLGQGMRPKRPGQP